MKTYSLLVGLSAPLLALTLAATPAFAAGPLMTKDVIGLPGKEVRMSTVESAPGAASAPHRHNGQVFVYVLSGTMVMQVEGSPPVTIGPGETFYEGPDDVHVVSKNASSTEPAKFLVLMIVDKNKSTSAPAR